MVLYLFHEYRPCTDSPACKTPRRQNHPLWVISSLACGVESIASPLAVSPNRRLSVRTLAPSRRRSLRRSIISPTRWRRQIPTRLAQKSPTLFFVFSARSFLVVVVASGVGRCETFYEFMLLLLLLLRCPSRRPLLSLREDVDGGEPHRRDAQSIVLSSSSSSSPNRWHAFRRRRLKNVPPAAAAAVAAAAETRIMMYLKVVIFFNNTTVGCGKERDKKREKNRRGEQKKRKIRQDGQGVSNT